jgi:hypothetical protein
MSKQHLFSRTKARICHLKQFSENKIEFITKCEFNSFIFPIKKLYQSKFWLH